MVGEETKPKPPTFSEVHIVWFVSGDLDEEYPVCLLSCRNIGQVSSRGEISEILGVGKSCSTEIAVVSRITAENISNKTIIDMQILFNFVTFTFMMSSKLLNVMAVNVSGAENERSRVRLWRRSDLNDDQMVNSLSPSDSQV